MADLLQGCRRNEMANQLLVVIMLTIHCVTYIYIYIDFVICEMRDVCFATLDVHLLSAQRLQLFIYK